MRNGKRKKVEGRKKKKKEKKKKKKKLFELRLFINSLSITSSVHFTFFFGAFKVKEIT